MTGAPDAETVRARIGNRLRGLSALLGIDRAALARAVGTTETRMARVMKGSSDLSAVELVALSDALGVHPSVITGHMPPPPGLIRRGTK